MQNVRLYGSSPYDVAVIHGGPGAPGMMAPVARELTQRSGVLEPLQTKDTLEGQVQELKEVLTEKATFPVTLIGSSWGAMLGLLVASRYPEFIKKVVLVGSGVFEERYAEHIQEIRFNRLGENDRAALLAAIKTLNDSESDDKKRSIAELGRLTTKADAFDPITLETECIETQFEINTKVWKEVIRFRANGGFVESARHITCPVVIVHGDYDPHPIEGIVEPLSPYIKTMSVIILKHCGHLPWIEKQARQQFFDLLKREI